ncbi:solute carrier family 12 member 9-like isoform X2 [Clupea harengus]|uniref:Solute carrier family 12 member 9 n=1 Tax=Clupea harengus TaxID=7950 RepID=A0A6P8EVP4_CLUHA|nr:solute carrier family 12 member 9-like isoform X2 [Clupea harengus]
MTAANMSEKTPLLHYRLSSSSHGSERSVGVSVEKSPRVSRETVEKPPVKLSTFVGVIIPTVLSMFSVVIFLRIGFVVGHAGLYQSILMFLVAYLIITMTVLSVCAVSTNGAIDAGGAYYMISRALGPEFGADGTGLAYSHHVLPVGYWWSLLYASGVLLLCLVVCLVGANVYAKATLLIFFIVMIVLSSIFVSFFIVGPRVVVLPAAFANSTLPTTANFTGVKLDTLLGNLWASYTVDYTTGSMMSFITVFAVMFNGCTGIMAGSNMSGDLKNPGYSIPHGTLTAVVFTFITYNLLAVLVSCSCERLLLLRNYSFLRDINIWCPLVMVGIYSSTLSAAMSNLIGASRILFAVSRDNIFGGVLAPASRTSETGNPWVSVLISWSLVQVVLLSGKLNTIASIVTICFLLVYAAVDLACLALEWASAPNFRPTFRYFTWHTCALGIVGCLVMMFLISAVYASASIAFMLVLLLLIHYLCPSSSWGYVSQALIFHQVRKYLLKLDVRKDHVKFWRPQVLLMVANPRSSTGLITFINDVKKSGLYVLGHVQLGELEMLPADPLQPCYNSWLSLVDHLNIKAFVSLTLADSVRHGIQHLLFISGLGGMRPNILVLGFYDDCSPKDNLQDCVFSTGALSLDKFKPDKAQKRIFHFPAVRGDGVGSEAASAKDLSIEEYVFVIADAVKMQKSVALARYFCTFNRSEVFARAKPGQSGLYVDVWPLNLLRPDSGRYVDTCSLFLLQLACVLNMSHAWHQARLRLFLCVKTGSCLQEAEKKLQRMLKDLRITADVYTVPWDHILVLHGQRQAKVNQLHPKVQTEGHKEEAAECLHNFPSNTTLLSDEYLCAVNLLIRENGDPPPAVRFLYLPHPPADTRRYTSYLHQLDLLSRELGPTMLIHGVAPVLTTDL